jgi:hypothetical protein
MQQPPRGLSLSVTLISCRDRVPCHLARPALPANQGPATAHRDAWLHEIKHDGFRVVARKDGHAGEALQPPRQRPHLALHADRGVAGPPALALLHHRRRGGVLQG